MHTITGCAVTQHCYNGDVRFLWEQLEIWPPVKFKPLNRLSQIVTVYYVYEGNVRSKFGKNPFTGDFWANRWNYCDLFIFFISEARAEIKPFDRFWSVMAQNVRNHPRMCLLGVKIFNFNIWPLFTSPKCQILSQNSNFKPKWWNMKVQVYQKLLNQWTWKFDTMLRTWNSVLRSNMMASQQIQYGGRPPYWKSSFGYISASYCSINAKFCMKKQNQVQTQVTWPKY